MANVRRNLSMSIEMKFLRRRRVTMHFNRSIRCSAVGALKRWLIPVRTKKQNNEKDYSQHFAFLRRPCMFGETDRSRMGKRYEHKRTHEDTSSLRSSTTQPHHKKWKVDVIFFFPHQWPRYTVCVWIIEWMCSLWWVCVSVSTFDWIRFVNFCQFSPNMDSNFSISCLLNELSHVHVDRRKCSVTHSIHACLHVSCDASPVSIRANIENFYTYLFYDVQKSGGTIERCWYGSVDGKVSLKPWMDWMSVYIQWEKSRINWRRYIDMYLRMVCECSGVDHVHGASVKCAHARHWLEIIM